MNFCADVGENHGDLILLLIQMKSKRYQKSKGSQNNSFIRNLPRFTEEFVNVDSFIKDEVLTYLYKQMKMDDTQLGNFFTQFRCSSRENLTKRDDKILEIFAKKTLEVFKKQNSIVGFLHHGTGCDCKYTLMVKMQYN